MVSINHYATSESIPFLKISLYSGSVLRSLLAPYHYLNRMTRFPKEKTLNPASFPNVAISFIGSPFFVSSYHNLHGTQRRICRSEYFLAHQQIPHPLSLHVPRTKTQPGKYRNLAGLVLYLLSTAFQSIFAVRFPHTDTRLPSVRHRKSFLASSVLHHMGHQPQVSLHQDISGLQVPLRRQFQIMPLFLGAQWLWEASGMELQGVKQAAEQQPHACNHHLHLSTTLFSISHGYSDGTRFGFMIIRKLIQQQYAGAYTQTSCFAAICKETLFAFAVSRKECGSFSL